MKINSKANFLLLVIVILLAVGVVGATIYFLTKKAPSVPETSEQEISEQPVPQEPEKPTSPQVEEATSTEEKQQGRITCVQPQRIISFPKLNTSDWETYRDEKYGFEIKYPKEKKEVIKEENGITVYLPDLKPLPPLPSGEDSPLNRIGMKIKITIVENIPPEKCSFGSREIKKLSFQIYYFPYIPPILTDRVLEPGEVEYEYECVGIQGVTFEKVEGGEAAAGTVWSATGYSTWKDNKCYLLACHFDHVNTGTMVAEYPKEMQEELLEKFVEIVDPLTDQACEQIISTFRFIK